LIRVIINDENWRLLRHYQTQSVHIPRYWLTFTTSTPCVPAHFWEQGQQFLNEVERRLSGMPLQNAKQTPKPKFPPSPDVPNVLAEQVRGAPVKPAGSEPGVPGEIPLPASVATGTAGESSRDPCECPATVSTDTSSASDWTGFACPARPAAPRGMGCLG
jgi:hypothetical protein